MKWIHHSNRVLVDAIIASFCDPLDVSAQRLRAFRTQDWERTEFWLDTSGLALYFLDRLQSLNISNSIHDAVLAKLRQKMMDNKGRTVGMFEEFSGLNRMFSLAGIRYANLKGFTLTPVSCPDISLRHQSDYDFLVDPAHLDTCRTLLEGRGYLLTGSTKRTLEYKRGNTQRISLDGHYRTKPVFAVELHTSMLPDGMAEELNGPDERLDRSILWKYRGECFPALSGEDQLIGQALHILAHLRGEHTRPSWLLEFRNHLLHRQHDVVFWRKVNQLITNEREATLAIGLSTLLAEKLFGTLPAHLEFPLPPEVRLWAKMYGRKAVLAEVPGTKLYHLLHKAIAETTHSESQKSALRLLPFHFPPRILRPPPKDNLRLKLYRNWVQAQYVLYRAHFHLKGSFSVMLEIRRWALARKRANALSSQNSISYTISRREEHSKARRKPLTHSTNSKASSQNRSPTFGS